MNVGICMQHINLQLARNINLKENHWKMDLMNLLKLLIDKNGEKQLSMSNVNVIISNLYIHNIMHDLVDLSNSILKQYSLDKVIQTTFTSAAKT